MKDSPYRTVLVGFGQMGHAYANDPVMARHYPYATHAQVLHVHPAFDWKAVVDVSGTALEQAKNSWKIPYTANNVKEIVKVFDPEVAILSLPSNHFLEVLESMANLKAVILEKPLGTTLAECRQVLEVCKAQGLLVQVNLWRRCDEVFVRWARGEIRERIGDTQAVVVMYGNGLMNNGTHMVDLVRMFFGNVKHVQTCADSISNPVVRIEGDRNVAFSLVLDSGIVASFHPLSFSHYRENGMHIWGTKGRISVLQEGLYITVDPIADHQAMSGEHELAYDSPELLTTTVGTAYYRLYDNLYHALTNGTPLASPIESAFETARIIDAVLSATTYNNDSHSNDI